MEDNVTDLSDARLNTTHLPGADAVDALAERSLEGHAELEGVASYLDDVVDEGTGGGEREGGREERDVAELDEHLQVVLERVFVLRLEIRTNYMFVACELNMFAYLQKLIVADTSI